MKIKKDTVIRTFVLLAALVNQALIAFGKNVLPWSEDELYTGISTIITVIASVAAWWKNNSFTQTAICADRYLEQIRDVEKHV